MKKLVGVLSLHMLCLVMLVLPNDLQGPVVFNSSGIDFRVLDITAITLIILGSAYLFSGVLGIYKTQGKFLKELLGKNDKKSGE